MRDDADDERVVEDEPPDSFGLGPPPGVRLPPPPPLLPPLPAAPTILFVDDWS